MVRIKNKFLYDMWNQLCELFETKDYHVSNESEEMKKMKDKILLLTKESDVIMNLIQCNKEIIECIEKEQDEKLCFMKEEREKLLLKKENIELEFNYFSKMNFLGQYEVKDKYDEEMKKEEIAKAKEGIEEVKDQLESAINYIPDGSQQKVQAIGMVHQYLSHKEKMTDETYRTMYKEMRDMYRRSKQYLPQQNEQ